MTLEALPEFLRPPVTEVVFGVQFTPPQGYSKILAGEVWRLFKSLYPVVEEQSPLQPSFETFGPAPPTQFAFGFMPHQLMQNRFWFLSDDRRRLIQFQNDRLMHNWRKLGDEANVYPRFATMIASYAAELALLQDYFASLSPQTLNVTQCEVSYFNTIPSRSGQGAEIANWLKFFSFEGLRPDDLGANLRVTLRDKGGDPIGRMFCEVGNGPDASGLQVLGFNLTVRGAPKMPNVASAIEFMSYAREVIVRAFDELTTESAHKEWGKV